uniref:Uncharacterized protein n=1 Tax=Caenorhabditis tropicalis TaxID=1561998 RepID=A0A1I7UP96_9PELO
MAHKRSSCSPLPKAARASEEIWVSTGQMGGFEMSTMGRWNGDEKMEGQRRQEDQRPGGSDDDEGRIRDEEAAKGEKTVPEGKNKVYSRDSRI